MPAADRLQILRGERVHVCTVVKLYKNVIKDKIITTWSKDYSKISLCHKTLTKLQYVHLQGIYLYLLKLGVNVRNNKICVRQKHSFIHS